MLPEATRTLALTLRNRPQPLLAHPLRQLIVQTCIARRYHASNPSEPLGGHSTVKLPDGRTIGWAEAGSPTGFPLFLLHGSPSSRFEVQTWEDLGRKHGLRVICPERPGYGLSTFQPNRRLLDWPADLRYLAQHLRLNRYSVLGVSGGGPYALACAYAIPSKELSAVGLFSSAGPWEAGTHKAHSLRQRLIYWIALSYPSLLTRLFDAESKSTKRLMASNRAADKKLLDTITIRRAAQEGMAISQSDLSGMDLALRERMMRLFLEPFAQGSRGYVDELNILSRPFGFRLEDVRAKVLMWHGTADANAPISMVRYMKERLPDCELWEWEGETHFTIGKYQEDVMLKLSRHERATKASKGIGARYIR